MSPTTEQDLKRDFTRSRRFGLVGVIVVMVLVAVIASVFGQGTANPTGLYIAIFVIIFGFVFVLLRLQRRDLDTAETRRSAAAEATGPITEVTDPTTANSRSLLAALAIGPIDEPRSPTPAPRPGSSAATRSPRGAIMMVLIGCAVIPWQLFQTYWTLYLFVPMIVGYAGFSSRGCSERAAASRPSTRSPSRR